MSAQGILDLIGAATQGDEAAVSRLLAIPNLNVNAFDDSKDGQTALMQAAYKGHSEIVKKLLHANADVNLQSRDSRRTALMYAVSLNRIEIARLLLRASADVNLVDEVKETALIQAAFRGSAEMAKMLLQAGAVASINNQDRLYNQTALMWAVDQSHLEVVKVLVQAGADVNPPNVNPRTALICAAKDGKLEIVKILLQAGANLHAQDKLGQTPLLRAAESGHTEVVKALLQAVAARDWQDEGGSTALMLATREGHVGVVQALLQAGANVHLIDKDGKAALMRASTKGNLAVLKALLAGGADANGVDKAGWTALMYSAKQGNIEMVRALLEAGADPTVKNQKGKTAPELSTKEEITKLLTQHKGMGAQRVVEGNKSDLSSSVPVSAKAADKATVGASQNDARSVQAPSVPAEKAGGIAEIGPGESAVVQSSNVPASANVENKPSKEGAKSDLSAVPDPAKVAVEAATIARALQQGSKEWRRSKFSVVGEGRAGKTAFTNAVVGKTFEETASTVGINQLTCDVKHVKSSTAGGRGEQHWGESKREGREYETALAELMALQKLKREVATPKGADIRDYIKSAEDRTRAARELEMAAKAASEVTVAVVVDAQTRTMQNSGAIVKAVPKQAESASSTSSIVRTDASHASTSRAAEPSLKAPVAAARASPASEPSLDYAYNEEMVMKMLATMKDEQTNLLISLFDFGGQSVFDVIHHLFLTRNGVYALVFNMEWLIQDGPEKDKALLFMRSWLSSIAVHTYDKGTKITAPIVLVGTRLDLVPSSAMHGKISTLLHAHFSDNLAWRSVLENEDGRDSNGKAIQCFFPVDNKAGKKGETMKQLMSVVHGAIEGAAYTHKQVPLTWFKLIDQMSDTKRDCMSLSEVSVIAARCGVTEPEIPLFLAFLHDMGHLMWHNEPELRDVVILDPISYLVTPATIIICKLRPDDNDNTHHSMQSHRECAKLHKHEWMLLKNDGVLSTKLLPILWNEYLNHSDVLLLLMVKFKLLVPLRNVGANKRSSKADTSEHLAVAQYLVPTLLTPTPVSDPNVVQWTDHALTSSCYFVFTLAHELESKSTIIAADLKSMGFLPGGMFERLIGQALSWSQDTAKGSCIDLQSVMLYKDMAVLSFGQQRFRIVHCADIHCIRVDIEGQNPIAVQQKLSDFIVKIMDECMKSLHCFSAVSYVSTHASVEGLTLTAEHTGLKKGLLPTELLIPLQQLRGAAKGESMLAWRGGRTLINTSEIRSNYGQWLQLYDLRERYDVFISYRWSDRGKPQYDSDFTEALFDMLTNFSVGERNRAVEVFLDHKRLQDGRLFKVDFAAALCNTLVAVPVVTMEALSRMLDHSADRVDNVLLEWIIMIECFIAKRILKVYPIVFGSRHQSTGGGSGAGIITHVTVRDFFSDYGQLTVPMVIPTATLAQAAELLRANNVPTSARFETYTVHSILAEMQQYLLCKASDYTSTELVEAFAGNVADLLSKCGESELDKVVALTNSPKTPAARATILSSAPASPQPPTSHASFSSSGKTGLGPTRPLQDLTIEELCAVLERTGLKKVAVVFAEKEVTGELLSYCEQVADLQDEVYGITSAVVAKGLMKHVKEWVDHGVPCD